VKWLTIVAVLLTALFTGAVRLPASMCPIASAQMGKACHGCCANKKCCADSQKNYNLPSQPLAKDSASNHDLMAVAVVALAKGFSFQSFELRPDSSATQFANSAPRLALLCTFLI
jgi:hypothetical protein